MAKQLTLKERILLRTLRDLRGANTPRYRQLRALIREKINNEFPRDTHYAGKRH